MQAIVDCHYHAGKGDVMTHRVIRMRPWDFTKSARAAGTTRTVVVPPFHSNYSQANAELAWLVARYPRRLIGFAAVHASRDASWVRDLVSRAVVHWGFCGFKVRGRQLLRPAFLAQG